VSHRAPRGSASDAERLQAASIAAAGFLATRTEELVDDVLELLRAELPEYGEETMEELRERVRIVLELAQRRLRQGDVPDVRDAEEIATLARSWAAKGLPLDQRSFQLGARRVVTVVAAHAAELDLDPRAMFDIQDRIWAWATLCASILADAHRDHAVALARRDAAGRAEFFRDLVASCVSPERLAQASQAYGLDVHQPYFAVCVQCDTPAIAAALEVHIRHSGSTDDHRTLQIVLDQRLLAVTPRLPSEYRDVTIAVGPAAALEQVASSFSEAFEALATARAFGITGVVDLASLGPLPLVT
jgi:GGDEF-like domain